MFNKFVSISFSIAFGVAPVIMYKQKSIYHRSFSFFRAFFFNQQSFIQLLTVRTTKALNTLHELIVKFWSPSDSFFKCWSWPWWCTVANLFGNNKEKINKISCIYVCVSWNFRMEHERLLWDPDLHMKKAKIASWQRKHCQHQETCSGHVENDCFYMYCCVEHLTYSKKNISGISQVTARSPLSQGLTQLLAQLNRLRKSFSQKIDTTRRLNQNWETGILPKENCQIVGLSRMPKENCQIVVENRTFQLSERLSLLIQRDWSWWSWII